MGESIKKVALVMGVVLALGACSDDSEVKLDGNPSPDTATADLGVDQRVDAPAPDTARDAESDTSPDVPQPDLTPDKQPSPDLADMQPPDLQAPDLPDMQAPDKMQLPDLTPDTLDMSPPDAATGPGWNPKITWKKVGNPTWKPVDIQLFEVNAGYSSTGYMTYLNQVLQKIAPNHKYYSSYAYNCAGWGTGTAHSPPYDTEIATGLKAAGYVSKATWTTKSLKAPQALMFCTMLVPTAGAPTGSTFSYTSGPIIDPKDFEIGGGVEVYHNGKLIDPYVPGGICHPPPVGANWSHSLWCWIDNEWWIPGTPPGNYEVKFIFNKGKTNGWVVSMPFTVTCEDCTINGKCEAKGTTYSTCGVCDPTSSKISWTVSGNYCLIDNACYSSGALNTTGCGTCDPTKSKYSWTPVANKCLICGTCYSHGVTDTTGCLSCDSTKNPTGWTPAGTTTATSESFESGLPSGWTISNSSKTVGWQVSKGRASCGLAALYYGDPVAGNYDSGTKNSGTVTLPAVSLTAGKKAGLSFRLWMDTEVGTYGDKLKVYANGTQVWEKTKTTVPTMKTWQTVEIDLSAYAGKSVTLKLEFDTYDNFANNTEGVYIDGVTVYYGC